jgi:hypothetical protein
MELMRRAMTAPIVAHQVTEWKGGPSGWLLYGPRYETAEAAEAARRSLQTAYPGSTFGVQALTERDLRCWVPDCPNVGTARVYPPSVPRAMAASYSCEWHLHLHGHEPV